MAVTDRPLFRANGGMVGNAQLGSPFANSMKLDASPMPGIGSSLGQGGPQLGTTMQQQMQGMQQNPLETYKGYLGNKYIGPMQQEQVTKVDEFVDLVGRAEQQHFGGQQGGMRSYSSGMPPLGQTLLKEPAQRSSSFEPPGIVPLPRTQGPGSYAEGGGANKFPDLSGDGKITQKDILMGRGVIAKQEGGPVMPQEAAGQVQMASEAEGQQVGLDYVANTLGGIDQAEDIESMINAIRGNDMPIEARRTELAEFVGQDDAMATPEAVLAMVQPAIMLTEEGAMNSGIGDLMQGMTSDIDMATEGGQPTDMGQGVGQLMMAGAPMEEAPQQFAAGGSVQKPVQYFAQGTPPPFFNLDEEIAALSIAGGPQTPAELIGNEKFMAALTQDALTSSPVRTAQEYSTDFEKLLTDAADLSGADAARKQQMALDLAAAGFQFASGRDAQGRNIAGQPFLSQVGAVAAPFAQRQAERLAKQRDAERAIKIAAVKEGIGAQTRAQATQDKAIADARQALLTTGLEKSRQQLEREKTDLEMQAAAKQFEATIGYDIYDAEENERRLKETDSRRNNIQQEQMALADELQRGRMRLAEDLSAEERADQERIQRRLNLQLQSFNEQNALSNFEYSKLLNAQNFSDTKDLTKLKADLARDSQILNAELQQNLQDSKNAFVASENRLERNLRSRAFDLEVKKFELQETVVDDRLSRLPSTDGGGLFGTGESQQEQLNRIELEMGELQNQALEQNIDLRFSANEVETFINLRNDQRQQRRQALDEAQALLNSAASTQGALPYGTAAEQSTLLGDTSAIQLYAQGLVVPGFDQALTEKYGRQSLDVTGRPLPNLNLPPALRSALQARQEMGLAIPRIPGFAQGGSVQQQLPGGSYDPITGRLVMPGAGRSAMPTGAPTDQRSFPPRITQDIEDITLATGGREAIGSRFGTIANLAGNIIFGIEPGIARDTKQAQKAVETLSTIATTTLMAAIPGKDNVELQRMLKNLQVPAGTFALQDEEAFDYFKIARQTMDLGIENQTDLLQNANLNRREIAKVQEDLAQMNAIKAEYDNVIQAYENKLKPSEEVFDELDKFFK